MGTTTVGIVLFDDVEELDAIGPWEVLKSAAQGTPNALTVVTIAEKSGLVRCAKGLRVQPDHNFSEAPKLDVILVPGGRGTRSEVDNPAMIGWIADVAPDCRWVTSVCTGVFLLLKAGPARDRRVTTHWGSVEKLRESDGVGEVLEDIRFVRDGNLVSSAGVSAGIDMALWLVGTLFDPQFARRVQKQIE